MARYLIALAHNAVPSTNQNVMLDVPSEAHSTTQVHYLIKGRIMNELRY
jgi:hypothetical protein